MSLYANKNNNYSDFCLIRKIPPNKTGIAMLIIYINSDENIVAVWLELNSPMNNIANDALIPISAIEIFGII